VVSILLAMPTLKTTWSLPDRQAVNNMHMGDWEERREELIKKLCNPKENPDVWCDRDKNDFDLLLKEQLDGEIIESTGTLLQMVAKEITRGIDNDIINTLLAVASEKISESP